MKEPGEYMNPINVYKNMNVNPKSIKDSVLQNDAYGEKYKLGNQNK